MDIKPVIVKVTPSIMSHSNTFYQGQESQLYFHHCLKYCILCSFLLDLDRCFSEL